MKKSKKQSWEYNDTKVRKLDKLPDPKLHQQVSFIKSAIRLIGYAFLPFNMYIAMGVLVLSEVIGIIEELV